MLRNCLQHVNKHGCPVASALALPFDQQWKQQQQGRMGILAQQKAMGGLDVLEWPRENGSFKDQGRMGALENDRG